MTFAGTGNPVICSRSYRTGTGRRPLLDQSPAVRTECDPVEQSEASAGFHAEIPGCFQDQDRAAIGPVA
jgi:hypothetical protein